VVEEQLDPGDLSVADRPHRARLWYISMPLASPLPPHSPRVRIRLSPRSTTSVMGKAGDAQAVPTSRSQALISSRPCPGAASGNTDASGTSTGSEAKDRHERVDVSGVIGSKTCLDNLYVLPRHCLLPLLGEPFGGCAGLVDVLVGRCSRDFVAFPYGYVGHDFLDRCAIRAAGQTGSLTCHG
jgi:hypothetical protein